MARHVPRGAIARSLTCGCRQRVHVRPIRPLGGSRPPHSLCALCRHAITSLGLFMAIWHSRVGRAVAATVSVYVAITVGWFFLVLMLSGPGARSEGLLMASPFMWMLVATAISDAYPAAMGDQFVVWEIIWPVALALCAMVLLVASLLSFDHKFGRTEGPSLRLLHGEFTRFEPRIRGSLRRHRGPGDVRGDVRDRRCVACVPHQRRAGVCRAVHRGDCGGAFNEPSAWPGRPCSSTSSTAGRRHGSCWRNGWAIPAVALWAYWPRSSCSVTGIFAGPDALDLARADRDPRGRRRRGAVWASSWASVCPADSALS